MQRLSVVSYLRGGCFCGVRILRGASVNRVVYAIEKCFGPRCLAQVPSLCRKFGSADGCQRLYRFGIISA